MTRENTELVRQLYEAGPEVERLLLDGSDLADHPWLAFWHPDCVLEETFTSPTGDLGRQREASGHLHECVV